MNNWTSTLVTAVCLLSGGAITSHAESGGDLGTPIAPTGLPKAHATIHCIGIEWPVEGDYNGNAKGLVEFREAGTGEWKKAFPLRRSVFRPHPSIPKLANGWTFEQWPAGMREYALDRFKQNYLAGSIFNLKPATKYDVRITLQDPDGGGVAETIQVTTRAVTSIPKSGNIVEVKGGGDALKKAAGVAKAGDVLLIHAGKYQGGVEVKASGTAEKPICIKAAGDGQVLLHGGDAPKADLHGIEVSGSFVYIEGLAFYNFANCVRVNKSAANAAVMRCKMDHFYTAIKSQGNDGYFADNTMRDSYNALDQAVERNMRNEGHGVELGRSAVGNVMCHNAISLVADAFRSYGRDTDIYGNDFIFGIDDFVEFDDGGPNQRVWENRISYCGENAFSFQPYIGGPAYVIRNVVFGQKGNPIKNRYASEGAVFINNTLLGNDGDGIDFPYGTYSRNNLLLVIPGKGRSFRVDVGPERLPSLDMDFDGIGPVGPNGQSLADFCKETGLEKSSLQFAGVEEILAQVPSIPPEFQIKQAWTVPDGFLKAKNRPHPDLSLKAGSKAIGAGQIIPNISAPANGKHPDLGALQFGKPLPHYGPRNP